MSLQKNTFLCIFWRAKAKQLYLEQLKIPHTMQQMCCSIKCISFDLGGSDLWC